MKKHIANILTGSRVLFSIVLLFLPVFSFWFYALYLDCGLTDMTDGTVARKLNAQSEFGSRFDTVADFIFVVAAFVKIVPETEIPKWIFIWVCVIEVIKVINIISGFVCQKKFVSEHTVMNKITGLLLFLLPLTLSVIELKYSGAVVCAVATFAAIHKGRPNDDDVKAAAEFAKIFIK